MSSGVKAAAGGGDAARATTCSVAPGPVAFDGTNASRATITVRTTARSAAPAYRARPPPRFRVNLPKLTHGLLLLLLTVVLVAWGSGWLMPASSRANQGCTGFLAVVLLVLLWVACGGGLPVVFRDLQPHISALIFFPLVSSLQDLTTVTSGLCGEGRQVRAVSRRESSTRFPLMFC